MNKTEVLHMITSQEIKAMAKRMGADIVGIGSIDRWSTAPIQMDPKQIMPKAKSIIALGFRVLRGSLRGIEEGTYFSNYSAMGYGGITYLYMPMTVINLSKFIEDQGYEAIPMGHQSDWRAIDNEGILRQGFSKPVAPGKPAPDIMVHLRIAAYLCGLGEIGWSKMLLTPEFGPLQRVAFIFTDAELEYDEMYNGKPLCRKCGACVRQCPGGCIPAMNSGKTVSVNLAGKICEWGDIDMWRCYAFYTHAGRYYNPFVPKEVWDKNENGDLDLMEGVTDIANEQEIMKKIYIILLLLVTVSVANGQTKAQADSAYVNNDYAGAVEMYEAILTNEGESSDIYYNLGNSYYKMDNIAKAILNYERALLLNPGDGDIRFNLELAQSKAVDKVVPMSEMFFVTWAKSFVNMMSEKSWSKLAIVTFILMLFSLAVYFFGKKILWKKIGFIVAVCMLLVCVVANVSASSQKEKVLVHNTAIIMVPSVTVKSTPNETGTDLFILHEGRKVMIKDNTMREWKEIQLEDGNAGWVPASVIEII